MLVSLIQRRIALLPCRSHFNVMGCNFPQSYYILYEELALEMLRNYDSLIFFNVPLFGRNFSCSFASL